MRTCSNCGASVREGAKFCTSCGTRLNEAAATSQHDTWSAPAGEPETVDAAHGDSTASDVEATSVTASATDAREEASAESRDGFTWSWGGTSASNEERPAQVDEESGTVLDEGGAAETPAPEVADATELEILEDQPEESEESIAVPAADDASQPEDQSTPEAADATEQVDDDQTLAAWAGEWREEEDEAPPVSLASTGNREGRSTVSGTSGGKDASDDDEDTVEKAERLIAELRRIIPSLARPRPINPDEPTAEGNTVRLGGRGIPDLAQELESARADDSFDDVRETIQTARTNPRDVDTMLNLAARAERLMALLEDRDRMARTLESLASRLREQAGDEQEQVDRRRIL